MKKGFTFLIRLLFFLPAIAATLLSFWVFVYPFFSVPQQIDFPFSILFFLLTLWGSGILFCFGKCWGGVLALIVPVFDVLSSQSGYRSHQHLSTLPMLGILAAYYLICAWLCWRMKTEK